MDMSTSFCDMEHFLNVWEGNHSVIFQKLRYASVCLALLKIKHVSPVS
jgi:hypothetical protein